MDFFERGQAGQSMQPTTCMIQILRSHDTDHKGRHDRIHEAAAGTVERIDVLY